MTECWKCYYNLGGLHCVIHKTINIHGEYCKDYEENKICLYLKKHGDDEQAYIALKDGRKFVLDKMNW